MYYIVTKNDCDLLNFESIGYSKNPKVTRFGPAQRNQYIVHFVTSGKGYFNGNLVSAGEGFITTPAMLEHYYPASENPWEFVWFISSDDKIKPIFNKLNPNNTPIFTHYATENLKTLIQTLKLKNKKILTSYEALEMFLNIIKNSFNHDNDLSKQSNKELYLDVAVNYIKNNTFSVNVNKLTEILGISQTYLHKIFKEKFSVSTKQYINEYKIHKAKKLLIETDLSVTQIASSVGFCDVLSFSKFFSKNVGISPQNFRISKNTK